MLLAALAGLALRTLASPPPLDPRLPATAWSDAERIELTWDVVHSRAAQEPTVVRLLADERFLYVRFDVAQRSPVIATQRSNDLITGGSVGSNGSLSWSNDDAVWVDLWPNGPAGFEYQFEANARGAHNESSSENTAFAPEWRSFGTVTPTGYTVTMAIPLAVIHGAHAGKWSAQFLRYARASGSEDVWSYAAAQTNADDPAYAGHLSLETTAAQKLQAPRAGLYALGATGSRSGGGSTSRVGGDISIPVSATASLYATLHPDYSNVELDQQTIAPSVYQRIYTEVRPFFTQAASYYNIFYCMACPAFRSILYTPAIPTPSEGYAFEGKEGSFGLSAFDAVGPSRTDTASVLDYTSSDAHWLAAVQHVTADMPGIVDDAEEGGVDWQSGKHVSANVDYSIESGTNVTQPSQGRAIDGGITWKDQNFVFSSGMRKVGDEFNPVDGVDGHPGVAGYGLYSARSWTFAPSDALQSIGIGGFVDRYQGVAFGQSQSDNSVTLDALTKSAWDLQVSSGSNYWRFGSTLEPISQSAGFALTYHSGLVNNLDNFPAHGTSATPTSIQYSTGRYGTGTLDTWLRTSTIRVGNRGSLTITLDDTAQWMRRNADNVQWFDGLAYAYQIASNSSLAFGVQRVIGSPPEPNGGGNCETRCSNVSLAYHLRLRHEELYLAYGDPNTLDTVPQALFKLIFYPTGQKGT